MSSGLACHGGGNEDQSQKCNKLTDYCHQSSDIANVSKPKTRRSLRLMNVTDLYSSKALNGLHHKELSPEYIHLSPKQKKAERLNLPKQNHHAVELIMGDFEITSITLKDLKSRCMIRKSKAVKIIGEGCEYPQLQLDTLQDDKEPNLNETIVSMKLKLAKSSSGSVKRKSRSDPPLHSLEKTRLRTSPSLRDPKEVLQETGLKEANEDKFLVNSTVDLKLNLENLDANMDSFADQSPTCFVSVDSALNKEKIVEMCLLNEADSEICFTNFSPKLVSEHDSNGICSAEFHENVGEGGLDGSQRDSSINIVIKSGAINVMGSSAISVSANYTDIKAHTSIIEDAPSKLVSDGDHQVPLSDEVCVEPYSPCCLTTSNHLLDAAPLANRLLPSDATDSVEASGYNGCQLNVSKPYESVSSGICSHDDSLAISASPINEMLDIVANLPSNFLLESPTQADAVREITKTIRIPPPGIKCDAENFPKKLLSNRKDISPKSQEKLLQALNEDNFDENVQLSSSIKKLLFYNEARKKPLSSIQDGGKAFLVVGKNIKKQKIMRQTSPQITTIITKGILKSSDTICRKSCCSKNSSIHTPMHDAILFSNRQLQDTKSIAAKLLQGLNTLKCIVEYTLFSAETSYFPSTSTAEEIRLATKQASELEESTKKWLSIMEKDCTRFCKLMSLAEDKLACPVATLHKQKKKITFADEAGGLLCQVKVYHQEPVAFIVPKS
ncbi:hypothetical protein AXF42_Ash009116 [Apostasia shenzhenica]|uniref:Uncharacterized protein n=1 Tax=Apostasia shenzhenica TaxID=1088818 RepID=A0A2I0ADJ7_9ASPA|nr:hypothetical protein AXF42_Ash009116 [Apostasia shenzhenica]